MRLGKTNPVLVQSGGLIVGQDRLDALVAGKQFRVADRPTSAAAVSSAAGDTGSAAGTQG